MRGRRVAVAGVAMTMAAAGGMFAVQPGALAAGTARVGAAVDGGADDRLVRFERQKIDWHKCQIDAKDELGKQLDAVKARCAKLTVPLDYSKPEGRTITVAIARREATDQAGRLGTLFINTGGPSESKSGVTWVAGGFQPWIPKGSPEVASRYDLVSMDPRFMAVGQGTGTVLECGWPSRITNNAGLVGPDRRSFERSVAANKDLAARCAKHKDVLPHVSTRNMARDMDVIRAALGEEKLSYLGWSYGGILGAVYTQMFPGRVDRVVLDSSPNPDTWGGASIQRDNNAAQVAALRKWAAWAARHDDRYHLGTTTDQVLAAFDRYRKVADQDRTLRIGRHRVNANALRGIGAGPDPDDLTSYRQWTDIAMLFLDAARGRKVTPTPELDQWLAASDEVSAGASAAAAVWCADRAASRDPEAYYRDIQAHRASEPFYGPLNRNVNPCTFWPTNAAEPPTQIHNNVPVLMVGSTEDANTTYAGQQVMHRALTGSRMVTLKDAGGHAVYLAYHGAPCVDTTVDRYLLDGEMPAKDVTCIKDTPADKTGGN